MFHAKSADIPLENQLEDGESAPSSSTRYHAKNDKALSRIANIQETIVQQIGIQNDCNHPMNNLLTQLPNEADEKEEKPSVDHIMDCISKA